jgi:S1-C subfamily serine protease
MRSSIKSCVTAATVRLTRRSGQGVLVPSGYILTAAHCVKWSGHGDMALGDFFFETIKTRDGRTLKGSLHAAEPVADIAVIGAPDDQALPADCFAYLDFTETTEAVPLFRRALRPAQSLAVQVLTHKGQWVVGTVTNCSIKLSVGTLVLKTNQQIKGGTSGGPVVTESGELIGLVSWTSEPGLEGIVCAPWLALPRWITNRIVAS